MDDVSRRTALRAGVGAGAAALGVADAGSGRAATTPKGVTVATRNCYLGADLFRLLGAAAEGPDAVRETAGELLAAVDRSHVAARLDAVAAELARTEPDLVGIQEAALIRVGPPDGDATDVRYDFRETLLSRLAARDQPYRVVAATTGADLGVPATVDGEPRTVRLTDRDLLLARESVGTTDAAADSFDATLSLSRGAREVTVERGYAVADATVDDRRLTVGTTHLESASTGTRAAQVEELLALLADRPDPTVLLGDINSGPGASTAAYDRLTDAFDDAASDAGDTCCHAAGLRNAGSSLDARLDHVLVRGELRPREVRRVGADPADRVSVDGERLWPSDHAGLVATLIPGSEATAAATGTATATATATTTPSPTATTGTAPGFGVPSALAALAALAALLGGALATSDDD
jgi:endonuclease/exonuclease/phosphatase family metal-dependent hydrolase